MYFNIDVLLVVCIEVKLEPPLPRYKSELLGVDVFAQGHNMVLNRVLPVGIKSSTLI